MSAGFPAFITGIPSVLVVSAYIAYPVSHFTGLSQYPILALPVHLASRLVHRGIPHVTEMHQ